MVCLYHGDYGPVDPGFAADATGHRWSVDAHLLGSARNIGEAEAIQRHLARGEPVSWCHQSYSWVDQDEIGWLYCAAFVVLVLPYLAFRIGNCTAMRATRAIGRLVWTPKAAQSPPLQQGE